MATMRKSLRAKAHAQMKKVGISRPNKDYGDGSFFSKHWRDKTYR